MDGFWIAPGIVRLTSNLEFDGSDTALTYSTTPRVPLGTFLMPKPDNGIIIQLRALLEEERENKNYKHISPMVDTDMKQLYDSLQF